MIRRLIYVIKIILIVVPLMPIALLMVMTVYTLNPIIWVILGRELDPYDSLHIFNRFIPDKP